MSKSFITTLTTTLLDIGYCVAVLVTAPVWLFMPKARRKVFYAFFGDVPRRAGSTRAILIHAVSVGEVNATRRLIELLRAARSSNPLHFIVTTTTDTGLAAGQKLYGGDADVTVIRYPLDFGWAVRKLLRNVRPELVVLMELEVWPNFLLECGRRGVPVVVINGRLTSTSFSRYAMVAPIARGMFRRLRLICAQEKAYAERFIQLGADPARVRVTGTMKFDTADVTDRVAGAEEIAAAIGVEPKDENQRVWVCGSTGPGEEEIILGIYQRLLGRFAGLRLVLVPRKPERFNEVAGLIGAAGFSCVRRTNPTASAGRKPAVILIDTMGELRACYSLADIVFVGRTLVDLGPRQHGSDMIEPAALGKGVIVGQFTGNFAEPMEKFAEGGAMKVVGTGEELGDQVERLLAEPGEAEKLGKRAREVVVAEQGATQRHVGVIMEMVRG